MKKKKLRILLPIFTFMLAIAASVTTHARNDIQEEDLVPGYINGLTQPCEQVEYKCSVTDSGILCNDFFTGKRVYAKHSVSPTSCVVVVFRPGY